MAELSVTRTPHEATLADRRSVRVVGLLSASMAGLLVAAVIALPLIFVPGADDGYAFPKAWILRALGIAGAATFFVYVWRGGSLGRGADRRIDLPLASFTVLLVAASLVSVDRLQSFDGEPYQYQGLVTVLLYVGSFYVARLTLGSPGGFRMILVAIVGAGALVSVYGVAQSLGHDPFWSGPPDPRIISSVGQANDLAAYLDLVVVAALGLWATAGPWARVGLGAVVIVALVALALTFSRGGYLALAVALAALLVLRPRGIGWRLAGAIGLTVGSALLVAVLIVPSGRSMAERVVGRAVATLDVDEGSNHFHLDLWRLGIQVAVDHPLLGTGPETFPLVFRPYLAEVLPPDRAADLGRFRLESPHNELIGTAAEMGLPALLAYLAVLGACAQACLRRARTSDGFARSIALVVLAALAIHVVTTFFMTPEVSTSELFWIVLGAGLAAMAMEPASGVDGDRKPRAL